MASAIVTLLDHSANDAQQIVFKVQVTYIGNDVSSTGGHEDGLTVPVAIPGTLSQFPANSLAAIVAAVKANATAKGFTVASGHTLVLISGTLQ